MIYHIFYFCKRKEKRKENIMKKDEIIKKELSDSEARKQYYKDWRKKNKDKIKKHNETFWKKQAEKLNNKEQ
jgi:hypothetical protein